MTRPFASIALAAGALVGACGSVPDPAPLPQVNVAACRVAGIEEDVRCATLAVPEDRKRPETRRIDLHAVILPATGAGGRPPLFILQGGPGQAASDLASFYAETFAEARSTRDIVLLDQRGTGKSNPLRCSGDGSDENLQGFLTELFPTEVIRRCRLELEKRANLELYTTTIAMDDLDAVRGALGYERVSLYGTSYGTRAALVYLREYPGRVERMILKGVLPMEEVAPLSFARDSQRSLDRVIADCVADAACHSRFPTFEADVDAVFADLARSPARVTLGREDGAKQEVLLSGPVAATTLRSLLQSVSTQAQVPWLFRAAASGDYGPLADLTVKLRRAGAAGVYQGMQLSVICAEDAPLIGPGAERLNADTFLNGHWTGPLVKACREWPRGGMPGGFRRPFRSNVPVLLLSGYSDPATPPEGADKVARQFRNSRHIVVRYGSHSFSGLAGCIDKVMRDFLDGIAPDALEAGCADQIRRPQWEGS